MKNVPHISLAAGLHLIRRTTTVLSVIGGSSVLVLTVAAIWLTLDLQGKEERRLGELKRLKAARESIAKVASMPKSPLYHGLSGVVALEKAVYTCASDSHAHVNDLHAQSDIGVFVSRYEKITTENDLVQTSFSLGLDGSLGSIVRTLQGLRNSGVPMEIDTITVTRVGVDSKGNSNLNAHIDLRVLNLSQDSST